MNSGIHIVGALRARAAFLAGWCIFAFLLIAAPLVFDSGISLSLMAQMGVMMIFGLSYNMLFGQTGMLSFGHAVYSGLGAFCTMHALNLASAGKLPVPVTLLPLLGGLAGAVFGIVFGFLSTRRGGIAFAMITLGIGELVAACALMLPYFFGGEGGISGNRVVGDAVFGISYGPQVQVVYLIAFWLFLCAAAMYAFTRTPLGRIANAVRDNPERAAFIGYDPQHVRYLVLILSSFFAGISGALTAINFEIVTAESVGLLRSGQVLLFTMIGGAGYFFGPVIGAATGVVLTGMLALYTKAWQLYLGLFFIGIVMFCPGGVAHLLLIPHRFLKEGGARAFIRVAGRAAASVLLLAGAVLAIEMTYYLSLDAESGMPLTFFGHEVEARALSFWGLALGLMAVGIVSLVLSQRIRRHAEPGTTV